MNEHSTEESESGSTLQRLLALSLAAAILYLAVQGLSTLACWGLFLVAALVAWPIWQYRQETLLFRRRAVLARAAAEDSGIRRWLWAGSISKVLQVFVALFWALLLLGFGFLLRMEHWALLAADALLLVLLIGPIRRGLAGQIKAPHVGLIARGWPLRWANLALLTLAFLAVDFLITGAPDTRGLTWQQVAEQAFTGTGSAFACTLTGWLVGALAVFERLSWHAAEVLIPGLPAQELKFAVWIAFLLQAGLLAFGFTRLMLGVASLLDSQGRVLELALGESRFSKAFILTILVLALPYIYAVQKLSQLDLSALEQEAKAAVGWINPCREPDAAAVNRLRTESDGRLLQAGAAAKLQAERQVDETVEELFRDMEQGVDAYLDWYFTILGEYERLAALATGDFADLMAEQLDAYLFGETGFVEKLARADTEIALAAQSEMAAVAGTLGQRIQQSVRADPCGLGALDLSAFGDLERDQLRASASAGTGLVAGALTAKVLAKKASAAVIGKITAKKGFQMAAAAAGKVAAKKGGSVLLSAAGATVVCSPGGPLAAICGIVAGAAAWLAVDKAFVEIDEARFRDQMREDILAAMNEEREALAEALKGLHHASIDAMLRQLQGAMGRTFVPARDGF